MSKKTFIIPVLFIFNCSLFCIPTLDILFQKAKNSPILTGLGLGSLLATPYLYKKYRQFRTVKQFDPTLDNLNTLTFIKGNSSDKNTLDINELIKNIFYGHILEKQTLATKYKGKWTVYKNIPDNLPNEPIILYSRGLALIDKPLSQEERKRKSGTPKKGGAALETYKNIKNNIIHSPCVTFDYPDTRDWFSFGQEQSVACFQNVFNTLSTNYKQKPIVLLGLCRGSNTILRFLCGNKKTEQISGVILESPFNSLKNLTTQFGKNYAWFLPGSPTLIYWLFSFNFPNYKKENDNLLELIPNISVHAPILIGHLKSDKVISNENMLDLIKQLRQSGKKDIYLVIIDNPNLIHAQLTKSPIFQQICNAFLAMIGTPCDQKLAKQGQEYLESALQNAQAETVEDFIALND